MDTIIEKLKSAFGDMDTHSYNGYTDDYEYPIRFTVGELKCLYEWLAPGEVWR